jgi:hypothetical protein
MAPKPASRKLSIIVSDQTYLLQVSCKLTFDLSLLAFRDRWRKHQSQHRLTTSPAAFFFEPNLIENRLASLCSDAGRCVCF